ncbi:MAG: radical SAM protein [Bacteroidales bacterium]|jgi:radical SAM superfamily enzyme YgiQ (UPF0313 family)
MRVALINPPSPFLDNDAAYPPMGLLYVAGDLIRLGHEVEIIDLTGQPYAALSKDTFAGIDASLFGITCVSPNVYTVAGITNLLPNNIPVMVGGPHPSFVKDQTFYDIPQASTIVCGEAEGVLQHLMDDLAHGMLKHQYHSAVYIPPDLIPMPARHLVDLHKYSPGGEQATPIYTSRGCPYDCSFCAKITGRTVRSFSTNRILAELQEIREAGFKKFVVGDDNALVTFGNADRSHLLARISETGMTFRINQDARTADRELYQQYHDAGCTDISFGIESGSQTMLDQMNKRTTVEQNARAIETAQDVGLNVRAYYMVNFPGESPETVDETIRFNEEYPVDSALLSAFAPLPGSPVWKSPTKYGITWTSTRWSSYYLVGKCGSFAPCFKTEELSFDQQIENHTRLLEALQS